MSDDLVLVTGGAGYVGSHLTRKLLALGYRVRVLDNFLYGDQGLAEVRTNSRLEIRAGDICDIRDVTHAVQGVRTVVALAALVGDPACEIDPQEALTINFESTRCLLDASRAAGVGRLVFASSCSVYGANGTELLEETSHLNPVSLYARTRIMSEEVLLQERGPVEVIILRLATVCGLSSRMRFDLMVNTITARAAVDGRVHITGADQWRPHLHVQDAAGAFACAVQAPSAAAQGAIFNVGHESQNFTIGEVADKVVQHLPDTVVEYANGNGDRRSYRVSFARIRDQIGFVPSFSIDDAIEEVRSVLADGVVKNYEDAVYHNVKWLRRTGLRRAAAQ
ncbi:MAG TPA: NAD(P)-dependent oxidoreductase [Candidatus Kryptonia bacterium]|nr:NAD(P)-dependent oxidoreductase [Candidatus Kryptonia bacterium]